MLVMVRLREQSRPIQQAKVVEQRKARRFKVDWEVTIKGTAGPGRRFEMQGRLENLSSTGALLYLPKSLIVGAKLDIWIKIPFKKTNWMKYSAEVVRVERSLPSLGVAVKFDNLRPIFEVK